MIIATVSEFKYDFETDSVLINPFVMMFYSFI